MLRNGSQMAVDQLGKYIIHIDVDDGAQFGTGFFVAPGVILTCNHVVVLDMGKGALGANIKLSWNGKTTSPRGVHITTTPFPDLAVLTVDWEDHPFLEVGKDPKQSQVTPENYLFRGFPGGGAASGGYLSFDDIKNLYFDQNGQPIDQPIAADGNNAFLLKFKDSIIEVGQSGSPILDLTSDKVIGILRTNRSDDLPLGGLAIPISYVLKELDSIQTIGKDSFSWLEKYKSTIPNASRMKEAGDDTHYYLNCDRWDEWDIFKARMGLNYNQPLIYFVPGIREDEHGSMIDKFINELKGLDPPIVPSRKQLTYQETMGRTIAELEKKVNGGIFTKFKVKESANNNSAQRIFLQSPILSDTSVILIDIEIYLPDYTRKESVERLYKFFDQFVSFWDVEYPKERKELRFYVFVHLILEKSKVGWIQKILKGKGPDQRLNQRIQKEFKQTRQCYHYEELKEIEKKDVDSIFLLKKIRNHEKKRDLEKEFESEESWRMAAVKQKIREWNTKNL